MACLVRGEENGEVFLGGGDGESDDVVAVGGLERLKMVVRLLVLPLPCNKREKARNVFQKAQTNTKENTSKQRRREMQSNSSSSSSNDRNATRTK